jgi:hypothetical protein
MRFTWAAVGLGALLAAPSFATEAKPQPPYLASLLSEPDTAIEACHISILARDDLDSPPCVRTLWKIWSAQKKANVKRRDFNDKAAFKAIVAELTLARNEKRRDQLSAPQSQQVRDNIEIVVGEARSDCRMTTLPNA